MFSKFIVGKSKIGIVLHILSITAVLWGFYLLAGYGRVGASLLFSPLQILGLFAIAPVIAIIGSTVILLEKLDQIITKETPEPTLADKSSSGSEEVKDDSESVEQEEEVKAEEPEKPSESEDKEEKPGLASRIMNLPLWLMVLISGILAAALTFLVMFVIFRILV